MASTETINEQPTRTSNGNGASTLIHLDAVTKVFLTDEVEGLDRRDALYGGALAVVGLVVPIITVPTMTGTMVKVWSDRAEDTYRLNLSTNRPPVSEAAERVAAAHPGPPQKGDLPPLGRADRLAVAPAKPPEEPASQESVDESHPYNGSGDQGPVPQEGAERLGAQSARHR